MPKSSTRKGRQETSEPRRFNVEVVGTSNSHAGLVPRDVLEVEDAEGIRVGETLAFCSEGVLFNVGRLTRLDGLTATISSPAMTDTVDLPAMFENDHHLCRVISITRNGHKLIPAQGTPLRQAMRRTEKGVPRQAEVIDLAAYRSLRQSAHRPDLALHILRLQTKRKGAAK